MFDVVGLMARPAPEALSVAVPPLPRQPSAEPLLATPWSDDAALVAAAVAGDREARRRLYEDNVGALSRFARSRCRSVHEAEDLVHDTFVRAFAALPRWRDQGHPFSSYLFTILRNLLVAPQRRRPPNGGDDELLDLRSDDDVEADVLRRLEAADLHAALAQLPERFRVILEMRFLEQREPTEIAQLLDLKPGTVRVIVHRALTAARRSYETPSNSPSIPLQRQEHSR